MTDLRAQLGGSAVPCPKMDIGAAFSGIAAQALGIAGFFPYNTDLNFLLGEPQDLQATHPQWFSYMLRNTSMHHTPLGYKSL